MHGVAMNVARPNWRFLFAHPAHFLALGFGAGLAPVAPGTFGTLVAIPIASLLRPAGDSVFALAIVWDEVVAFLAVLFFVGDDPRGVAFAFVLFRVFDILKPPPIRQLERRLSGGLGVMADDIGAAAYTLLAHALVQRLIG